MTTTEALRFLGQAATVHIAGRGLEGAPILRTVHGVVLDGQLLFHSSPKGEKLELVGEQVVAQVEEPIATVPSTFFDPERACPATTYYRSVQAHGVLAEVHDPAMKARALQALMEKLQPEGGYRQITAADPMYQAAVRGIAIVSLPLTALTGKAKLAQNRTAPQRARLLEQLWKRGALHDARAIELIRAANDEISTPPAFLSCAKGYSLHCWLSAIEAPRAAQLLAGAYWNDRFTKDQLQVAHERASAWVGVRTSDGTLIGTARGVSDFGKRGWIYDVWVEPEHRRRGLAKAMMRLLLEHPALRDCAHLFLGTRDMQALYGSFGFVDTAALPPRPYATTEMVRLRR